MVYMTELSSDQQGGEEYEEYLEELEREDDVRKEDYLADNWRDE